MSFTRQSGWKTKPRVGCRIDHTHPDGHDLLSWWMFNEGAGAKVYDIASGFTGTLTNGDPITDWVGTDRGLGLDLDGTNDYVLIPDQSAFTFGNGAGEDRPFSVVIRCKFRSISTTQGIVTKFAGAPAREWIIYQAGGIMYFEIYNSTASTNIGRSFSLSSGTHLNAFRTYIMTYSGTRLSSGLKIYVDGVRADTATAESGNYSTLGMVNSATDVLIGSYNAGANLMNAIVEDVRIYKKELTVADAVRITQNPYAAVLSSPIRRFFVEAAASSTPVFQNYYARRRRQA